MPTYLSLGQLRLYGRPGLALSGIAEQIHDNCTLRYSLIHVEQICTRNPPILLSLIP